jgi:hypothetical protein
MGKPKNISAARLQEVLHQSTLTALGIRDAYLLEGISMTEDELMTLLQEKLPMNSSLNAENTLGVLPVGFADLVIVNVRTLMTKLSLLREEEEWEVVGTGGGERSHGAWRAMNQPLLVNIDGSEPTLCGDREYKSIKSTLLRAFESVQQSLKSDETTFQIKLIHLEEKEDGHLKASVGYPFLAGWLLGYVCMYHCTNEDGSALVNKELEKTSINASKSDKSLLLAISEFSCPTSILDISHWRDTFREAVTAKVASIQERANSLATKECFQAPSGLNVTLDQSFHRLTAVTL